MPPFEPFDKAPASAPRDQPVKEDKVSTSIQQLPFTNDKGQTLRDSICEAPWKHQLIQFQMAGARGELKSAYTLRILAAPPYHHHS